MSETSAAEQALLARYRSARPDSRAWQQGVNPLAGGSGHDSWRLEPYPVVFERAQGIYKWDVDGRRYLDLWMGHGALLFGNAHPAVVAAVARQMEQGQHPGGVHRLHFAWAERIRDYFPACEQLRFTASGSEATQLALRIARVATGRGRIVRVDGHFHGWFDDCLARMLPAARAGFNPGVEDFIAIVPPLDADAVEAELSEGDVAALILEPGGGSSGSLAWSPEYLAALRALCDRYGSLLIFDEVISGFRYHLGGVQAMSGVRPDLTLLAKIAAGGMPGALVGGSAALMALFDSQRLIHSGTFNGCPITAAAALATLELIGAGEPLARANEAAAALTRAINAAASAAGVDVGAYAQSSIFHLVIGAHGSKVPIAPGAAAVQLAMRHAPQHRLLRMALLLEGVDCHANHGWLSALHSRTSLDEATQAFGRAFEQLRGIPAFDPACGRAAVQ
jgi:glutamate-1-semialdehyde 2,1-aminomutase